MSIQDDIRELLTKLPNARVVSGGREVLMRCKYCPDSDNPTHAHFYVSLGYNDTPFYFYCHKCKVKGILTYDKLISWGLFDNSDIGIKLIQYNKTMMNLPKNSKYSTQQIFPLSNNYISDNRFSEVKLKYINNRLGTNMDYNDIKKNKIVLNINDLFATNKHIKEYTRKEFIVQQLNNSFLGFISYDNAFINLRNLTPGKVYKSIDKRYVNYNIFNKFENTQKFYIKPVNLNITDMNRIKIHIAEGPFDALGIYYNLRQEDYNNIYCAITGSGYTGMCMFFIHDLKLMNIEFHLYPDNDVDINRLIYTLKPMLNLYNIPLTIHTNTYPGEKDFGVRPERIKEQVIKVLG